MSLSQLGALLRRDPGEAGCPSDMKPNAASLAGDAPRPSVRKRYDRSMP